MSGIPLHQTALTLHQARAVQTVDDYWHKLASGPSIPRRADINPGVIQDALEYAFIAEHLSNGMARFRVVGGSIGTVLGMEVTGMPLSVVVSPDARESFTREIAEVFANPRKLCMTMVAPAAFRQPALEAQLRLYPLCGGTGRVSHVIGTFVTTGVIGCTPRRFGIASIDSSPVSHPSAMRQLPVRTRGHLTLVICND